MIKKLRRRFIIVNMSILTCVLFGVLTGIFAYMYSSEVRISYELIESILNEKDINFNKPDKIMESAENETVTENGGFLAQMSYISQNNNQKNEGGDFNWDRNEQYTPFPEDPFVPDPYPEKKPDPTSPEKPDNSNPDKEDPDSSENDGIFCFPAFLPPRYLRREGSALASPCYFFCRFQRSADRPFSRKTVMQHDPHLPGYEVFLSVSFSQGCLPAFPLRDHRSVS